MHMVRSYNVVLTEKRGNSTLKPDLIRAAGGVALMILGLGTTLGGGALSLVMMAANPALAKMVIPGADVVPDIPIIVIPPLIGSVLYFAGFAVAGKSRAGVAASGGMGAIVFLVGSAMFVIGLQPTSDGRGGGVLLVLGGPVLALLGIASVACSVAMAFSEEGYKG